MQVGFRAFSIPLICTYIHTIYFIHFLHLRWCRKRCVSKDSSACSKEETEQQKKLCAEDWVTPGSLTAVVHHHPVNTSSPDAVLYLNESRLTVSSVLDELEEALMLWQPESEADEDWPADDQDPAEILVKIKGFLKVLKSPTTSTPAWSWDGEALQACQGPATSMELRLAQGAGRDLETLSSGTRRKEVSRCYPRLRWPRSGRNIYLYPGNLYRLEVTLTVEAPAHSHLSPANRRPGSALFLLASSGSDGRRRDVLPSEYLLPYSSGVNCSSAITCLGCLEDSLCIWCPTASGRGRCISRKDHHQTTTSTSASCGRDIVAQPVQCPRCGDLLTCQSCLGADNACEWQMHLGRCIRRGRTSSTASTRSIMSAEQCASPCHRRSSCATCVSDDCVWCENTQECFAFSSYTTRFAFGRCSSWLDRFKLSPSLAPGSGGAEKICQVC